MPPRRPLPRRWSGSRNSLASCRPLKIKDLRKVEKKDALRLWRAHLDYFSTFCAVSSSWAIRASAAASFVFSSAFTSSAACASV